MKGDFDPAWNDCQRAAQLAEDVALVQVTQAGVHYGMGNYESAMEECEHTFTLHTVTPVAYAKALVIRGKCRMIKGDYELAAADFDAVLTRSSRPKYFCGTKRRKIKT